MKNHGFETRASSLYEAVRIFGENGWIEGIGRSQTPISIMLKHAETEHAVNVQDFECWLEAIRAHRRKWF